MRIPYIESILLCLQTAAAVPFVTNPSTGISYQGTSANGVDQFQNISFAKDTSGANRFAPPVPFLPKNGTIVQATAIGLACPQPSQHFPIYPFSSDIPNQSEDCLNLRIARPATLPSSKPLPVMVWIFGGGFTYGESYDEFYNPEGLVQASVAGGHPVIYVSANYRLGIFGFAASNALRDAKSENIGLRDQRLALQWVKDNIAAFGGDPDNITIFGQSAGAIGTASQIIAFGGKQGTVFQKAITDSGSLTDSFEPGLSANNTAGVAQMVNCSSSDSAKQLACLRAVPRETLFDASLKQLMVGGLFVGVGGFRPIIDGDFIPDKPTTLIAQGSYAKKISLMDAWVEDDGSEFVPASVNSEAAVEAYFSSRFGNAATSDKVLSLYPVEDFASEVTNSSNLTSQFYRASRILRDVRFVCPALNLTRTISQQRNNSNYLFTVNSTRLQPVWDAENKSYFRIGHSSDVAYFFNENVIGADNSPAALQLSAQFSSSFSEFATSGNPKTPAFNWPPAYGAGGKGNATIFVIGGPYGSGPATLGPVAASSPDYQRSKALGVEKLLQRCAVIDPINS